MMAEVCVRVTKMPALLQGVKAVINFSAVVGGLLFAAWQSGLHLNFIGMLREGVMLCVGILYDMDG